MTVLYLTANNPSAMTFEGTNSYLKAVHGGWLLIDPGPAGDEAHLQAIAQALGNAPIVGILLTHGHQDHAGAAAAARDRFQAPLCGFAPSLYEGLELDRPLKDGDVFYDLEVIHTPGHAADHLCYAQADGTVFTGDHVMGWSSSFIPKRGGSLSAYLKSLEALIARDFKRFLPGHGAAIESPNTVMQLAVSTRLRRESQILNHLTSQPQSLETLAEQVYGARAQSALRAAILQTMSAHLIKLAEDARAHEEPAGWSLRPQC